MTRPLPGRRGQVERQDLSLGQDCEPCDPEPPTGSTGESLQRGEGSASHGPRHAETGHAGGEGESRSNLGSLVETYGDLRSKCGLCWDGLG